MPSSNVAYSATRSQGRNRLHKYDLKVSVIAKSISGKKQRNATTVKGTEAEKYDLANIKDILKSYMQILLNMKTRMNADCTCISHAE